MNNNQHQQPRDPSTGRFGSLNGVFNNTPQARDPKTGRFGGPLNNHQTQSLPVSNPQNNTFKYPNALEAQTLKLDPIQELGDLAQRKVILNYFCDSELPYDIKCLSSRNPVYKAWLALTESNRAFLSFQTLLNEDNFFVPTRENGLFYSELIRYLTDHIDSVPLELTSLELKNFMRESGVWVTQAEVSKFLSDLASNFSSIGVTNLNTHKVYNFDAVSTSREKLADFVFELLGNE